MGARGPKPGFKKARVAPAAAPFLPTEAQQQEPEAPALELSAADRENPSKLTGQALRDLAHRRGMAKSILIDMPEEKIRMELRYITNRQYEDAVA